MKTNKKSPVNKRLNKLSESAGNPVIKKFRDLKVGEQFSMTLAGKIMKYNGDITGTYSISSPSKMCYFMGGYKDETRVDGYKEDLLNADVYSYGFPDGYVEPDEDTVHDEELIDLASSTTYRDSIMSYANQCKKAENRKLILSLLDDPDVILEEGLENNVSVKKSTKKTKKINENEVLSDRYAEFDIKAVQEFYKTVAANQWIDAMFMHYLEVRNQSDDDHNEMSPLVIKEISRLTGQNVEHLRCIFGYAMLVIDLEIIFVKDSERIPAYIHMTRRTDTREWKFMIYNRNNKDVTDASVI